MTLNRKTDWAFHTTSSHSGTSNFVQDAANPVVVDGRTFPGLAPPGPGVTSVGVQVCYEAVLGSQFERGYGAITFNGSTYSLVRQQIEQNSNGTTSAISFNAGVKTVYAAFPYGRMADVDDLGGAFGDFLQLVSADSGGAAGPTLQGFRNSASPAALDHLMEVVARAKNASGGEFNATKILSYLKDATAGSEDSALGLMTYVAGSLSTRLDIAEVIRTFRPFYFNNEATGFEQPTSGVIDVRRQGSASPTVRFHANGSVTINDTAEAIRKFLVASNGGHNTMLRDTSSTFSSIMLATESVRSPSTAFYHLACYSSGAADPVARIRGDGQISSDAGSVSTPADVAEAMLWEDGNAGGEDRRGRAVVIVGYDAGSDAMTIRMAGAGEVPDGVVSSDPSLVMGAAPLSWHGKWETDEFGVVVTDEQGRRRLSPAFDRRSSPIATDEFGVAITEEEEVVEEVEVVTGHEPDPTAPPLPPRVPGGQPERPMRPVVERRQQKRTVTRTRPNPDFDPALEYRGRMERGPNGRDWWRSEWAAVALVGKVPLLKGEPTAPRWKGPFAKNDVVDIVFLPASA